MNRALRVAVVGAGPAGMYAASHLLEDLAGTYVEGGLRRISRRPVEVDVLDRLPTPWGLIRYGVAPDHPEKKLVQSVFDRVTARPGFRFYGGVELGRDVTADELSSWYDAVLYAVGAPGDAHLNIPGEELPGCLSAREFVAWYNGHPDHAGLDVNLSCERAVIVGNGNVAMDVTRILTAPVEVLQGTDIAEHALAALRTSSIREVVVLGRRGPAQGAFNNPELEELGELPGVDIAVEGDLSERGDLHTRRKLDTLRRFAERPAGGQRRIVLRFLASPTELLGDERITGVRVSHNELVDGRAKPTGQESVLGAGLVLRSIGYFGTPIPGLPFDEHAGVVPNTDGRVEPGTYVAGWIKRGPRGIIGTNKKCARDTVRALLADAESGALPTGGTLSADDVHARLAARRPDLVDFDGWRRIDALERRAGAAAGRPRVKLTDHDTLVATARQAS